MRYDFITADLVAIHGKDYFRVRKDLFSDDMVAFGATVIQPFHWKHLVFMLAFLCLVTGCGSGGSSSANHPNLTPVLSSLAPTIVVAGTAALAVTVSGSNFISTSLVDWNGTALPTTYVSSTSLTASVPASDLSSIGTVMISVQTPAPGGGTSGSLSFTISPAPNPIPVASSLSPANAIVGSAAFSLTVSGSNFISGSQVLWNGTMLPTTYVSSTSLTANVPASDLSSTGPAMIAVQTPAPGGGTSASLSFTISPVANHLTVLNLSGNDLAWDPRRQLLYVAVQSSANSGGGTITVVDPIAGSIVAAQQLSSAASGLAMSDDSSYLYAVTTGGSAIQRLLLPALTSDIEWTLGTDPASGKIDLAGDIEVQPGSPHAVAVSFGQYGSDYVAVFDDGVMRPGVGGRGANVIGNSLQWKPDGSRLYAAYTEFNDSPYYTSTSDNALYTMPVDQHGIGTVTKYDSTFRNEGSRLHSDPSTGYVYGDWGEVVDAATGIPIGNYSYSRPFSTYAPGPLSVVDPSLKRFYTLLEIQQPDGTPAFQIQAFDQTQLRLLSTIVVPGVVGEPVTLVRWGNAGLAFVTKGSSSGTSGKLYILDGSFVNPSGSQDTTAGAPLLPVPTLTAMTPITAPVGGAGVTVNVTGRDFLSQSTLYWNGTALPTTLVSSTELSAQIPASDLTSVNLASITATNAAVHSPASNSLPFSVNTTPAAGNQISVFSSGGNDLVWNAAAAKLYVSTPGIQGDAGNALGIVDPLTGVVTSSGFLGSEPDRLSLSDNDQYLYVSLLGANAIQQLSVPSLAVATRWNLGGVAQFDGPYYALDLEVQPGAPQTTAVTLASFDVSPSSDAVTIYDASIARPTPLSATGYPYSALQWAGGNGTIYAVDQYVPEDLLVLGVGSSGAVLSQHFDGVVSPYSGGIHYDAGTALIYTDGGQVLRPSDGSVAGTFAASGLLVPDSTLNRVFILGQTSAQAKTASYTIQSFDEKLFTAIGSITIDNVVGTPTALVRWGSDGLAFTTRVGDATEFRGAGPGQLYVVHGAFVKSSSAANEAALTVHREPVQKTWNLEKGIRLRRPETVVHRSPPAQ